MSPAQASQSTAVVTQPEAEAAQPDITAPDTTPASEVASAAQTEAPQASPYYDEELPPDFWNREGALVDEGQSIPLDGGVDDAVEALPRGLAPEGTASTAASGSSQELRSNPTYITMTELFPGKIVAWHDDAQDNDSNENEEADSSASTKDSEIIANPDEESEPDDDD